MAKSTFVVYKFRYLVLVIACIIGLFIVFKNASAGVMTLTAIQAPTAILINTPISTFVITPYPPPASQNIALQSERDFLPLVLKNYPPYHTESLSYYMWTMYNVYGLGCSIGISAAQKPEADNYFVFLDYGNPYQDDQGVLGTKLFDQTFVPIYQIASSVVVLSLGF